MIEFSDGLQFDEEEVFPGHRNLHEGVIPHSWIKLQMQFSNSINQKSKLNKIIADSCSKKVSIFYPYGYVMANSEQRCLLCFEDENDAIMFKIRGLDFYIKKVND